MRLLPRALAKEEVLVVLKMEREEEAAVPMLAIERCDDERGVGFTSLKE